MSELNVLTDAQVVTDEQVTAAARCLCDEFAADCNVDSDDAWVIHCEDFMLSARRALLAAFGVAKTWQTQPAAQVPDGWVLVPVEPTWDMKTIAMAVADREWCYHIGRDDAKKLWAAMLSASPSTTSTGG